MIFPNFIQATDQGEMIIMHVAIFFCYFFLCMLLLICEVLCIMLSVGNKPPPVLVLWELLRDFMFPITQGRFDSSILLQFKK